MPKLTDLTKEMTTAPADDDWSHIVNRSDTSESPQGSSYKIKNANLLAKTVLLNGRSGGQTIAGGTNTGERLLLIGNVIDGNGIAIEDTGEINGIGGSGGVTIENFNIDTGKIEQLNPATNFTLSNSQGAVILQALTGAGVYLNGGASGTTITTGFLALPVGGVPVDEITTTVDASSATDQLATADAIYTAIIGNGSAPVNLTITSYDQRTFTLPSTPPVPSSTHVYVNGKRLKYGPAPGGEYTISGTTLTYEARDFKLETDMEMIYLASIQLSGVKSKTVYEEVKEPNINLGNGRYRNIIGAGSQRLSFSIPGDFTSWAANGCKLQGVPTVGAAQAARDIDIAGEFANMGEPYNNSTFSDTTLSIDLSGTANQNTNIIDVTPYLGGVTAGDRVNLFVDHNSIGGGINYMRFALHYNYTI